MLGTSSYLVQTDVRTCLGILYRTLWIPNATMPLLSERARALDSGDVTLAKPALIMKASNDKI